VRRFDDLIFYRRLRSTASIPPVAAAAATIRGDRGGSLIERLIDPVRGRQLGVDKLPKDEPRVIEPANRYRLLRCC